ncbi:MAG: SulP family inorganic anion transporter [Syntrophorhabdaceae bacterium]
MADNPVIAVAGEAKRSIAGRYFTIITAGLISGVLTIAMGCAFSALIFSGPLRGYVSSGITLILFGALIIGIVTTLKSSYAGTIARPHEIPAAVIALIASSIAGHMAGQGNSEGIFITVVASIMVASVATGITFLSLGYLKAGNLIRFVPYPVIGGFLAGTGLLLVKGGFGVMADRALTMNEIAWFVTSPVMIKWLPGVAFALVLFFALRWRNHYLVMPIWLVISFGLFYLVAAIAGIPLSEVRAQGWVIGSFEGRGDLSFSMASFSQVDWSLVAEQTGRILTILILSCISLLLNASGLELVVKEEVDLNRELRATGFANLLSGFAGSSVGFHSLSLSALGYSMGAKSRLVGVFSALLCGSIIFLGGSILSYFPRPIMGGVLCFLGLTFLYEWLYQAWFKLPKIDCILILLILVVIGMFGFLQGVAVGMLVAIVIFVIKYSHVSAVKHHLSGLTFRSNVDRAPEQEEVLSGKGESLHILKLQGFIFFGTANDLYEKIRQRADDTSRQALRFVVLDFRLVNGVDSSAVNSFSKMKEQALSRGYALVFAQLSSEAFTSLSRGGFDLADTGIFRIFPDLDLAVEWCENGILAADGMLSGMEAHPIEIEFKNFFSPDAPEIAAFMKYTERKEVPGGFCLIRQNDPPHSLYYLESGRATVNLEDASGQSVRLRTLNPGTVIGELGLYLRQPSTASVITETPSVFYRITVDAMQRMERDEPHIAAVFHRFIVRRLGERLMYTNRSLTALLN